MHRERTGAPSEAGQGCVGHLHDVAHGPRERVQARAAHDADARAVQVLGYEGLNRRQSLLERIHLVISHVCVCAWVGRLACCDLDSGLAELSFSQNVETSTVVCERLPAVSYSTVGDEGRSGGEEGRVVSRPGAACRIDSIPRYQSRIW